jgi:hypothetical protein
MDTKVTERVENARSKAGHAMIDAGKKLRRGSKKAADAIKHGGERGAAGLESSGDFVSPRQSRRGRSLMMAVLAVAVLVVVAILFARGRSHDFDED